MFREIESSIHEQGVTWFVGFAGLAQQADCTENFLLDHCVIMKLTNFLLDHCVIMKSFFIVFNSPNA